MSDNRHHIIPCIRLLLFLLCSTAQTQANIFARKQSDSIKSRPTWEIPKLPEIKGVTVLEKSRAHFHGRVPRVLNTTCDIDCQKGRTTKPASVSELLDELTFETLDVRSSVRLKVSLDVNQVPSELLRDDTKTDRETAEERQEVYVKNKNEKDMIEPTEEPLYDYNYDDDEPEPQSSNDVMEPELNEQEQGDSELHRRRKRNIFGFDTRFGLPSRRYMTMYPFSTAVKLSTGCSGVLLSPKHVLTSAHCIHDGKRYVKGLRKLKIGKMMTEMQKKKGRKRKNRNRRKKGRKSRKNSASDTNKVTAAQRAKREIKDRVEDILPYFKWVRAKNTFIPEGWLNSIQGKETGSSGVEYTLEFDYAVIELKRSLGNEFMKVGVSPDKTSLPRGYRIHFTGFDSDRTNQILYRFCAIEEESMDLMYHYCDANQGSSGSGIYIRLYDSKTDTWTRKVIGVFSGHQWVRFGNGTSKEYNTGVRITPLKYAQICYWITKDYNQCRGG